MRKVSEMKYENEKSDCGKNLTIMIIERKLKILRKIQANFSTVSGPHQNH